MKTGMNKFQAFNVNVVKCLLLSQARKKKNTAVIYIILKLVVNHVTRRHKKKFIHYWYKCCALGKFNPKLVFFAAIWNQNVITMIFSEAKNETIIV